MSNFGLMKSDQELEEEIKNLGIEYRYSCYREKNAEGCDYLANFLEIVEKDYKKSSEVYRDNCLNNNYGKSCHHYASNLFVGRAFAKDLKAAEKMFERGCTLGFGDSCYMSGYMKFNIDENGKNTTESDREKGIKEWTKGCDIKHEKSCLSLSNLFLFGKYGVLKNMEKAFEFTTKSCELNDYSACKNLSMLYKHGLGIERNDEKAEFYHKKFEDLYQDYANTEGLYDMEKFTDEKKGLLEKLKQLSPFKKENTTQS
ncbi:Sel1 repeat-containing protein 1-like protein [Leptotrombidium deliense]|uniref:Sel1 repeat-containing protein 1-like protein n=1 Tax=Leptotrombidium deliense TaxID=299467 RepID=A0A443S8G3_9ACAR|nr:Sel1 repeat-containing protein 1-like protein [Leptotrombidium deliense]